MRTIINIADSQIKILDQLSKKKKYQEIKLLGKL